MAGRLVLFLAALTVAVSACTPTQETAVTSTAAASSSTTTTIAPEPIPPESFARFIGQVTADLLLLIPQTVTDLGADAILGSSDTTLDDLSPATQTRRVAIARNALATLDATDTDELPPDDQITAEVLRWHLNDILRLGSFPDHGYAANYITGYHAWFPEFMADIHPLNSRADAEAYIERLNAVATQMEHVVEGVLRSADIGVLPTQIGRDIAAWQAGNVGSSPTSHPLVVDFMARLEPLALGPGVLSDLETRAVSAVRNSVIPAYAALQEALGDIEPRSDSAPGVLHLPNGASYYEAILRHYTSTDISAEDAHSIGLAEVDRLRSEVATALVGAGYELAEADLAGALQDAEADAGSIPLASDDDRTEFLAATVKLIESSAAAFDDMFERFPETPVDVVRPRPGREGGSGAYYNAPPLDGSRPGLYYLSLGGTAFAMQTYATTNFHEAIPGHHFQLALQRESRDLPLLQRSLTFSGYAEGWGLYAERLAHEAGLYDTDRLGNIGRLKMELLRAARVVADTGIHTMGWSRQQAIDYLTELGFSDSAASNEVDRYVVWPGQAPSYMIGLLEILRLREHAQEQLGDDFNIAAFHTELLRHGSVPVAVLDQVVDTWIDGQLG